MWPRLAVLRSTAERGDEAQSAPSSTPAAVSEETATDVFTSETNEGVAAQFAGSTGTGVLERFVGEHQGEKIEFDGHISFPIESDRAVYSTAFVSLGDAQNPSATGPMFEFGPVLLPETSPLQQADLSEGLNVHIIGTIGTTYAFEGSTTYNPETEDRIVLVVDSVESR